jgi:hypothetical protein
MAWDRPRRIPGRRRKGVVISRIDWLGECVFRPRAQHNHRSEGRSCSDNAGAAHAVTRANLFREQWIVREWAASRPSGPRLQTERFLNRWQLMRANRTPDLFSLRVASNSCRFTSSFRREPTAEPVRSDRRREQTDRLPAPVVAFLLPEATVRDPREHLRIWQIKPLRHRTREVEGFGHHHLTHCMREIERHVVSKHGLIIIQAIHRTRTVRCGLLPANPLRFTNPASSILRGTCALHSGDMS